MFFEFAILMTTRRRDKLVVKNNVTNDFYRFDGFFDISYGNLIDSENFHPTLGICYSLQFKQVPYNLENKPGLY